MRISNDKFFLFKKKSIKINLISYPTSVNVLQWFRGMKGAVISKTAHFHTIQTELTYVESSITTQSCSERTQSSSIILGLKREFSMEFYCSGSQTEYIRENGGAIVIEDGLHNEYITQIKWVNNPPD